MAKVLIFTTGGTIASVYDEEAGGFMPALSADDLVRSVPGLSDVAEIETVELGNTSSTFLTPEQVFGWTAIVAKHLTHPEVRGAVITHGTDTLEESAYMFDLALKEPKPIVFTGAMRTSVELLADGSRNLLSSVRVAAADDARDLGVLVVMADEVHAARDVTKSDAEQLHSFISPNTGPIGSVSRGWGRDDVFFHRRLFAREHVAAKRIEPRVGYVKTVMGSDSLLIDALVGAGAKGVVLEAFGGGEVTPFMCDGIDRAVGAGAEVVVATRCFRGRPLDLYADAGEGRWLAEHGARFAGNLTGPKARVKLMLGLGLEDRATLDQLFP